MNWTKLLRLRTRWWNWVKTHSAVEGVLFRQLFWVLWLTPCFMLAIEGNRDPKFRCCGHDWMEMVCQYCRIWYLRKNWWRHLWCRTSSFYNRGGWLLPAASPLQPGGDAERGGVEGSGGSPPSLSLEAPEFQNVPCCSSLVSTLLHPKSSGSLKLLKKKST